MDEKIKAAIVSTGLSLVPIGSSILTNATNVQTQLIALGVIWSGAALVGIGVWAFAIQVKEWLFGKE